MKKLLIILPMVFLLCFTFGCQQAEEVAEGITEEEAKALLDRALDIWNEGNLDLIKDVFAPEIVAQTSTFPEEIVGHEGIINWVKFARTAFPDMNMTFDEIIAKGNKIAATFTVTGTNTGPLVLPEGELPPTGKEVRFRGIGIDYVENGLIVKELVVYNLLEMMMQLGFNLTPPQPPEPTEEKK
jgi:steroid delta-isomerase-like uncharacterized protein